MFLLRLTPFLNYYYCSNSQLLLTLCITAILKILKALYVINMDSPADCGGESMNNESVDFWDSSSVAPLEVSSMFSPDNSFFPRDAHCTDLKIDLICLKST